MARASEGRMQAFLVEVKERPRFPRTLEGLVRVPGGRLVGFLIHAENRPGVLLGVVRPFADRGINLEHVSACRLSESEGVIVLVADLRREGAGKAAEMVRDIERVPGVKSVRTDAVEVPDVYVEGWRFPLYITYAPERMRGLVFRAETLRTTYRKLRETFGSAVNALLYYQGLEYGRKVADLYLSMLGGRARLETLLTLASRSYQALGWGIVSRVVGTGSEVVVRIDENWEAEPGAAAEPSCHFTRGMLAGWFERLLGLPLACEETKCASRGDGFCVFRLTPR